MSEPLTVTMPPDTPGRRPELALFLSILALMSLFLTLLLKHGGKVVSGAKATPAFA